MNHKTRQDAHEFYQDSLYEAEKEGPDQVRAAMRYFCQHDLYYLLCYLIGARMPAEGEKPVHSKMYNLFNSGPLYRRDWLFERCKEIQNDPNGYIDLWAREHFKAVDLDEPILTTKGWKRHGDVQIGDQVYSPSGGCTEVVGKSEIFIGTECYRVYFDDGYSVVVSSDHLWNLERRSRRRISGSNKRHYADSMILSTEQLFKHNHSPDNRLRVPVTQPLVPPPIVIDPEFYIHPYALGIWLGDGTSANGSVTISEENLFIKEEIERCGQQIGPNIVHDKQKAGRYTLYGLSPKLKKNNLCNNKHIPDWCYNLSPEKRLWLLQGLMDSDGTCNDRGTACFTNKNLFLARDVWQLAQTLGLKPRWGEYWPETGVFFQVRFQAYENFPVFRLPRKFSACKKGTRRARRFVIGVERVESRPTSCIRVDAEDGMYLIGKNLVPTHNTTIITIALTIQDILSDPEITIALFSFNNKEAKKPYLVIKREFEDNQALKDLFPDILFQSPQEESPKWTEDQGIIVRRKGNPRNATLQAFGLTDGTNPAGSHFMIRVYDDIITEKHVGNPDMIKKALEIWRLSLNCGSIDVVEKYGESDIERYIGTRYHFNDPYREIMEIGAAKPRIYPGTDDGTPTGNPVMFTQRQLDKRRLQGPYQFSCQILQNPVADEAQGFMEEWLQYAQPPVEQWREYNRYLLCDPAGEKNKDNDYTAILVIGLGADENYYLLDGVRLRMNLTERAKQMFRLHRKYKPLGVGYEKYGKDSDIEHIKYVMDKENYRFGITELGGRTRKLDRIRKLIPLFETGRFYIPRVLYFVDSENKQHDLIKEFKEDEYKAFPVGVHDDILDCMARIVDEKLCAVFPDSVEWNYYEQYPEDRPGQGGYDMLNHSLNQYLGTQHLVAQQEVRR